jgi:DDE family transposase
LYAIPTWSRTAALIAEPAGLRGALRDAPSVYACYRFAAKLRAHSPLVEATLGAIVSALRAELPEYGKNIAIDASDLPAYANGQRYLSKNGPERERYSDPTASWGHRSAISTRKGGGFYGYRLHAAVCTVSGLPLAWRVASAREHESLSVPALLPTIHARGFAPETAALDMGYDVTPVYDACHASGVLPVIPLRKTVAVKRGEHGAPTCALALHADLCILARLACALARARAVPLAA